MPIKNILQDWNPILHTPSNTVDFLVWNIQEIITDLIDTMRSSNLVGIAAPQIGIPQRIFITEIRKTEFRNPEELDPLRIYINPEIIWKSTELCEMYEGCGSVEKSGLFGKISRPKSVKVRAFNQDGIVFELEANWLLARVIQHENDHINGILFTEHINKDKLIDAETYAKIKKSPNL